MRRMATAGILSILVMAAISVGVVSLRLLPDATACRVGRWEDPQALSPGGTLLRSPDLALLRNSPVITGLNLPRIDSAQFGRPFVLDAVDPRGSLGRPAGEFQFLNPRILVDAADRLYLMWAEAREPLSTGLDISFPVLTELWYAVRSDGEWASPVQLLEAEQLYWDRGRSDVYLDSVDGGLDILIDTGGTGPGPTVLLSVKNGAVSTDTVLRRGTPIYLDLTGNRAARHLAYLDWSQAHGGTRVQVVSSSDSGKTWSTPVVVDPETQRHPTAVWAFLGATGVLDVLWLEADDDSLIGAVVLRRAWREPGSTNWHMDEGYPLPEGLSHAVAAMDRCGGVHLVGDRLSDRGIPEMVYYERRDQDWVLVDVPVSGVASMEPALLADDAGVYLAWSEVASGATGPEAIHVVAARRLISGGG